MIRRSETRREKISTAKFANDYIKIIALHRQIHTHKNEHTITRILHNKSKDR
jgi:hypothetical protein